MSERQKVSIEKATLTDVVPILGLIALAPDALLTVTAEEIQSWIEAGHSLVAKDGAGEVIGHQGLAYWPESGVTELRSAYVDPKYRGMGINTLMKQQMMEISHQLHSDAPITAFTESASKSRGILAKLGFVDLPLGEVPGELFSICPALCVKKTGVDCGCKVFIKI